MWFMAHNCQTEQFIKLLNLLSPYFLLTQSSVFPYCHLKVIIAVDISVILTCY